MSTAHHTSAPLTVSPFSVRDSEDFGVLKRVLIRVLPEVKSGHLAEALAVGLGHATYSGMLSAAASAKQHSALPSFGKRKQVGIDAFIRRLHGFGYTDEQLHPLTGHAADLLRLTHGRFMCANESCPYGPSEGLQCEVPGRLFPVVPPHAREEAYSSDPAYRAIWSTGVVTAPQDGLCLNCHDDVRRDNDMSDSDWM